VIEAEQGRAGNRGHFRDPEDRPGRPRPELTVHGARKQRVTGLEQPAAEHHRRSPGGQVKPSHHGDGHDGDLLRLPGDEAAGHRVSGGRHREEHRHHGEQVVEGKAALVHRDHHVADGFQAEVRRDGRAQASRRPPAVITAHRVPHDRLGEARATAPVAGERAQCEVAGGPPVW
jgi:hypothetical protein